MGTRIQRIFSVGWCLHESAVGQNGGIHWWKLHRIIGRSTCQVSLIKLLAWRFKSKYVIIKKKGKVKITNLVKTFKTSFCFYNNNRSWHFSFSIFGWDHQFWPLISCCFSGAITSCMFVEQMKTTKMEKWGTNKAKLSTSILAFFVWEYKYKWREYNCVPLKLSELQLFIQNPHLLPIR